MKENDKPIATLDRMLSLEHGVWQALMRGDPAADLAALAEDFVGVYPSGLSDRAGHVDQLRDGPSIQFYEITAPRIVHLGAQRALLIYHARYQRTGRSTRDAMFVTSLWEWQNGAWQNRFSQDTPVQT